MDLTYLLHSLLRKKWIIVFCTLLGLVAGFVFTLFQPKSYLSFAQYSTGFTMEQKVKIKEEASFNIYEIDLRFNNVIETFRSPKVMGMLSSRLLLHDLESSRPFRMLTVEQKKKPEFTTVNLEKAKDILRQKVANMEMISPFDPEEKKVFDLIALYGYDEKNLSGKINFSRVERTDFINIFFSSENPELSAFVVNTIGEQFIRFFNAIYGSRAIESTAKLDSLVNSKKMVLDDLTLKLKDYRDKIGTPNVADRASAAMSVVQELTSNFQQEQAKLNNLRGELSAVLTQLAGIKPGSETVNNNAEILRLKNDNQTLALQKEGKPEEEVKRLQEQIDANLRRIAALSPSNVVDNKKKLQRAEDRASELTDKKVELEQKIVAAENNVRLFGQQKAQYEAITESGGGGEVILRAKEEELRLASQEYEQLKKSLASSADLDVNPENNFKQTMVGQPAYKPEPAKRTMILAMSGILMLFMSSFIIVGLEFMDTSFKTPSIFQRGTKLKLLSSLNKIDLKARPLNEHVQPGSETVRNHSDNVFVENLRKLRYEIESSGKKIFLVASTKAGEGKTTVIEALANSLSMTKKKVLLIDVNFSNNTLTRQFNAKPTLEQFSVNGQGNVVDKFWGITSMTSIRNTDLVGCAEGNYTPEEVLPKNNLLENLPKIAENYDFVFIEAASLNDHADAREISKFVDGIITVFSAKSVLKQTDKDSIAYLKSTGGKFVGTVLNNVEPDNIEL
ncbi:MAG: Wzz/FepE/Etk N-terminal domain-containing protein [Candidatus Pseudobacter hemicellulosilyticus]|uniref:Wzz/FepE/Etk N-terminal domain-containing protein n=1 Tax=Candidatus Pseudobacter hemicellulosilyticus TaxID=3121375 RepID=A0AAJ5WRY8_9BACT|nr:MAG: Wzz/FepE/Etk N-terminal domain-containing protein [Pseudobacter sp.]